mgnify:CR=1 FL=1
MLKSSVHDARDRQFRVLKKLSQKMAEKTNLDLKDVEEFVLKQEFFHALLYDDNLDLFISHFLQWQENKMGIKHDENRQDKLCRRIWGPL